MSPGRTPVLCNIAGLAFNCSREAKNEPVKEAVLWLVHFKLGVNTGVGEQSLASGFSKRLEPPQAGNRAGRTVRP